MLNHSIESWPGSSPSKTGANALMSRPSTSYSPDPREEGVDGRDKRGHDGGEGNSISSAKLRYPPSISFLFIPCAVAILCVVANWALAQPAPSEPGLPTQPADASPRELRGLGGRTDYSIVKPEQE